MSREDGRDRCPPSIMLRCICMAQRGQGNRCQSPCIERQHPHQQDCCRDRHGESPRLAFRSPTDHLRLFPLPPVLSGVLSLSLSLCRRRYLLCMLPSPKVFLFSPASACASSFSHELLIVFGNRETATGFLSLSPSQSLSLVSLSLLKYDPLIVDFMRHAIF